MDMDWQCCGLQQALYYHWWCAATACAAASHALSNLVLLHTTGCHVSLCSFSHWLPCEFCGSTKVCGVCFATLAICAQFSWPFLFLRNIFPMVLLLVMSKHVLEWLSEIYFYVHVFAHRGSAAVLFLASREFNTQAYNVEDVIVAAADNATASIHTVSATFSGVQSALQTNFSNFVATLNSTATDLDNQASFVQSKLVVNKKSYKEVIHIMYVRRRHSFPSSSDVDCRHFSTWVLCDLV